MREERDAPPAGRQAGDPAPRETRRKRGAPHASATDPPAEPRQLAELRGRLFTDLDRLAFALEMEAAEALESGDEPAAVRLEDQRLGVRLAQRLVSGVHADEVDLRLSRVREVYEAVTRSPLA